MNHVLFFLREQFMDWLLTQPDICKLIDQKYASYLRNEDENFWMGTLWREYMDAIYGQFYAQPHHLLHMDWASNFDTVITSITYRHMDLSNIECIYHIDNHASGVIA